MEARQQLEQNELHCEEFKKITEKMEKESINDSPFIDISDEALLGISNKMLKIGNFTTC